MNRIPTFLIGVLVGVVLTFGAQRYHLVRAEDGFHAVPRVTGGLADVYVNIRGFDLSDWNRHRALAAALVKADKSYLFRDAAEKSLYDSVDQALDTLGNGD